MFSWIVRNKTTEIESKIESELCPLTSAVEVVRNFQIPGTADPIAYLEKKSLPDPIIPSARRPGITPGDRR